MIQHLVRRQTVAMIAWLPGRHRPSLSLVFTMCTTRLCCVQAWLLTKRCASGCNGAVHKAVCKFPQPGLESPHQYRRWRTS